MPIRLGVVIAARDEATPALERLIQRTERASLSLSGVERNMRGLKATSERLASLGNLEKKFSGLQGKIASSETELERLQRALASATRDGDVRRLSGAIENLTARTDRYRSSSEAVSRQMEENRRHLHAQGIEANSFAAASERVSRALDRERTRFEALNRLKVARAQVRQEREQAMNTITGMAAGGESLRQQGMGLLSPFRSAWATSVGFGAEAKKLEGLALADASSGERAAGMARLMETARELGAQTVFSSADALQGMQVLARSGYSVPELAEATGRLLSVARAGDVGLDVAASVASSIINGFGLARTEIGKVGDVVAYAANKADASFTDMGEAFSYASSMSKVSGFSLEMAAASIGVMSDNAIKGSRAGTALKGIISRLSDPSKEATRAIQELGIQVEKKGKFRDWIDIFGDMQKKLDGLGNREKIRMVSQIFGLEAAPGAIALIENVDKLSRSTANIMQNATGFSAKLAAISGESAKSKVDALGSSFENLQITLGKALEPALVRNIESLTRVIQRVDRWAQANPVLAERITMVAAGLGGLAVVGGTVITTLAGIAAAVATLRFGLRMMGLQAVGASFGLRQLLGLGGATAGAAGAAGTAGAAALGTGARVARFASRGLGVLGAAASVGLDARDAFSEKDLAEGMKTFMFGKRGDGFFSQALKWGGLGAAAGSVIPGVGTLAGGLGGALFGIVGSGARNYEPSYGNPASLTPLQSSLQPTMQQSLLDTKPTMSRNVTVNAPVTVYPSPGMDERAIGESVSEYLKKKMAEDQALERARFHD